MLSVYQCHVRVRQIIKWYLEPRGLHVIYQSSVIKYAFNKMYYIEIISR